MGEGMEQPTQFFARQEKARALTARLVVIYLLGALALAVLPYGFVVGAEAVDRANSSDGYHQSGSHMSRPQKFWDPDLFLGLVGGTLAVIVGASVFKWLRLSMGNGGSVAEDLGGTLVPEETADPSLRRLRNAVEEICLAGGLSVPDIYILEKEQGINAFACGMPGKKPVVAVTHGALDHFTRDELQAVVAHEIGHIRNEDTRLNLRLIALAFGLFALTIVGKMFIRGAGRGRGKGNGAIVMFGFFVLLCGMLGVVFGQLMQAAVSRQREHLADADATQLTRNPQALANALKRIGGFEFQGHMENPKAMEAAHLFFASGISSLFATHPPLEERIRALEPHWDGKFVVCPAPSNAV